MNQRVFMPRINKFASQKDCVLNFYYFLISSSFRDEKKEKSELEIEKIKNLMMQLLDRRINLTVFFIAYTINQYIYEQLYVQYVYISRNTLQRSLLANVLRMLNNFSMSDGKVDDLDLLEDKDQCQGYLKIIWG